MIGFFHCHLSFQGWFGIFQWPKDKFHAPLEWGSFWKATTHITIYNLWLSTASWNHALVCLLVGLMWYGETIPLGPTRGSYRVTELNGVFFKYILVQIPQVFGCSHPQIQMVSSDLVHQQTWFVYFPNWVVVSSIFYFHPLFGEDSHFD